MFVKTTSKLTQTKVPVWQIPSIEKKVVDIHFDVDSATEQAVFATQNYGTPRTIFHLKEYFAVQRPDGSKVFDATSWNDCKVLLGGDYNHYMKTIGDCTIYYETTFERWVDA